MYLRESSRRNKDGSKVTYLQLAHNERHQVTGSPVAKVIHNFGRKDKIDKEALARLVSSISRILDLPMTDSSVASAEVEIVDSRRLGGAFVLDQLWDRLGIAEALRSEAKAAASMPTRLSGSVSPSSPSVVWSQRRSWPR